MILSSSGDSDNVESGHECQPVVQISSQPSSSGCEPPTFDDIGTILDPNKSIESISYTVISLSVDEKYSLLYHHIKPPNVLPCT